MLYPENATHTLLLCKGIPSSGPSLLADTTVVSLPASSSSGEYRICSHRTQPRGGLASAEPEDRRSVWRSVLAPDSRQHEGPCVFSHPVEHIPAPSQAHLSLWSLLSESDSDSLPHTRSSLAGAEQNVTLSFRVKARRGRGHCQDGDRQERCGLAWSLSERLVKTLLPTTAVLSHQPRRGTVTSSR